MWEKPQRWVVVERKVAYLAAKHIEHRLQHHLTPIAVIITQTHTCINLSLHNLKNSLTEAALLQTHCSFLSRNTCVSQQTAGLSVQTETQAAATQDLKISCWRRSGQFPGTRGMAGMPRKCHPKPHTQTDTHSLPAQWACKAETQSSTLGSRVVS